MPRAFKNKRLLAVDNVNFVFCRTYQRQEVDTLRKASDRLEDEVAKLKKQLSNEKFERYTSKMITGKIETSICR